MADAKISALTNYSTPLDADVIPVVDTANVTTKKTTWANVKATLKTYFDTLYVTGAASSTDNAIVRFDSTTGKLIQNSTVTIADDGVIENVNAIKLDTTPSTITPTQGQIYWDTTEGVPSVNLDTVNNVTLSLGTEQYVRVVNKTGVQINDGQVVYISGAQGNRPTASLAKADALATSNLIGVATQNIADNAEGFVTTSGEVHGYNTTGFTAGDKLYVSAATAGLITNVAPSTPNNVIVVGVALNSTVNGTILVKTHQSLATSSTLVDNSDLVAPSQKAVKTYADTKAPINSPTFTGTVSGITAAMVGAPSGSGTSTGTNTGDQDLSSYAPKASPTFTGTVTLPTGLTGVIRADSGVVSTDSDVTDIVSAASDTAAGKVELATIAETNTGTDATRAITPDGLAGSNLGIRYVAVTLNGSTALTTSDKAYFRIPAALTGMNLVSVAATVGTGAAGASSSGTPTFTVKNVTDNNQMLSTSLTVDANEYTSATAATAAVINTSFDDVVTDDLIEVACTTAGTGTTYATITLGFQTP